MTDLQISLMAIGGTIVVAVVSYNKWQEYKAKKTVERAFASNHDDVLMTPGDAPRTAAGGRAEPSFAPGADAGFAEGDDAVAPTYGSSGGAGAADTAIGVAADAFAVEPGSPRAAGMQEIASVYAPAPVRELPIDALVDCAIPLALGSNLRGEKVIGPIQTLRHVGNKPVNFIGLREGGDWEAIQHGVVYTALMAGVQLANRSTALNEIEFSELVMRLRQVADDLDAEPDVPNMTSVMQSSRALHQFVSQYDAQLSVNVQAKGDAWPIGTLLAALERQGFDVRPDGRLVMPDGDGGNLFSLSTNVTLAAESTTRLTLLLDVPCVIPERDGFGAMVACARSLSHRLDGLVVDDTDQPLSDASLAEIGEQVQIFYQDMQAAEIPAGSTRALRLFS